MRPVVSWQDILGNLQALPTDGNPVTSSGWHSHDEAFFNVAEGIHKVIMQLTAPRTLTGHTGYVWSVALSADGQTLVSGSDERRSRCGERKVY
jgi:WD40 repeat protein